MSKKNETTSSVRKSLNIEIGTRIIVVYHKTRYVVERTATGYKMDDVTFANLSEVGFLIRGFNTSNKLFGIIAGEFCKQTMGKRVFVVKPGDKINGIGIPSPKTEKRTPKVKASPKAAKTEQPKKTGKIKTTSTGHEYEVKSWMKIKGTRPSGPIKVIMPTGRKNKKSTTK